MLLALDATLTLIDLLQNVTMGFYFLSKNKSDEGLGLESTSFERGL
jgi:hypothetical protein